MVLIHFVAKRQTTNSPSRAPKGLTTPVPPRTDTSTAPEARMPEDTEDTIRSVVSVTEYRVRLTRLEVP